MVTKVNKAIKSGRPSTIPQQSIDQQVLSQFLELFKSARKHFQWIEKQTGVSGAQLSVLAVVGERPGIRVNDIANVLNIHQSTASNLINHLIKQGLARRERSDADKRTTQVFLNIHGKKLLKRAPKSLKGVLPEALGRMNEADLCQLKRLLSTLSGLMRVRDASGRSIPFENI